MEQNYFSVLQGAEYLGLSEKALRKWVERGRIPHKKLGRRVLLSKMELDRFVEALPGRTAQEALATVETGRRGQEVVCAGAE